MEIKSIRGKNRIIFSDNVIGFALTPDEWKELKLQADPIADELETRNRTCDSASCQASRKFWREFLCIRDGWHIEAEKKSQSINPLEQFADWIEKNALTENNRESLAAMEKLLKLLNKNRIRLAVYSAQSTKAFYWKVMGESHFWEEFWSSDSNIPFVAAINAISEP